MTTKTKTAALVVVLLIGLLLGTHVAAAQGTPPWRQPGTFAGVLTVERKLETGSRLSQCSGQSLGTVQRSTGYSFGFPATVTRERGFHGLQEMDDPNSVTSPPRPAIIVWSTAPGVAVYKLKRRDCDYFLYTLTFDVGAKLSITAFKIENLVSNRYPAFPPASAPPPALRSPDTVVVLLALKNQTQFAGRRTIEVIATPAGGASTSTIWKLEYFLTDGDNVEDSFAWAPDQPGEYDISVVDEPSQKFHVAFSPDAFPGLAPQPVPPPPIGNAPPNPVPLGPRFEAKLAIDPKTIDLGIPLLRQVPILVQATNTGDAAGEVTYSVSVVGPFTPDTLERTEDLEDVSFTLEPGEIGAQVLSWDAASKNPKGLGKYVVRFDGSDGSRGSTEIVLGASDIHAAAGIDGTWDERNLHFYVPSAFNAGTGYAWSIAAENRGNLAGSRTFQVHILDANGTEAFSDEQTFELGPGERQSRNFSWVPGKTTPTASLTLE